MHQFVVGDIVRLPSDPFLHEAAIVSDVDDSGFVFFRFDTGGGLLILVIYLLIVVCQRVV